MKANLVALLASTITMAAASAGVLLNPASRDFLPLVNMTEAMVVPALSLGLTGLVKRQGYCDNGMTVCDRNYCIPSGTTCCPNTGGGFCRNGGTCAGAGSCCPPGLAKPCIGTDYCTTQDGTCCDDLTGPCPSGYTCVRGGGCCAAGKTCSTPCGAGNECYADDEVPGGSNGGSGTNSGGSNGNSGGNAAGAPQSTVTVKAGGAKSTTAPGVLALLSSALLGALL